MMCQVRPTGGPAIPRMQCAGSCYVPPMRRSREWIEQELRRRIREGQYAPGTRMPPHRQLLRELGASSVTLQHAFDRLVELGYVDPRKARGTFVAARLPHHSTIALVFPDEPGFGSWNRFWATAQRVGEEWSEGDARFRTYCIAGQRADSPGHRKLVADLEDGALAGMVFVNVPFSLSERRIFEVDVPRVCIGGGGQREADLYGASFLGFVAGDIHERLVRRFHASGRKRLAALTATSASAALQAQFTPLLRKLDMETRPEWWLGLPVTPQGAVSARTVTHLLCSGPARQRPDCLVVCDDNLVPHASAGVLDARLQVPSDLEVACHANFPGPTRSAVDCVRFGTDMYELLRSAIAELARLGAGGKPQVIHLPMILRETARDGDRADECSISEAMR